MLTRNIVMYKVNLVILNLNQNKLDMLQHIAGHALIENFPRQFTMSITRFILQTFYSSPLRIIKSVDSSSDRFLLVATKCRRTVGGDQFKVNWLLSVIYNLFCIPEIMTYFFLSWLPIIIRQVFIRQFVWREWIQQPFIQT